MGDLRPLGSEKLQGTDKLKRIMEIARYKETNRSNLNESNSVEYQRQLADGKYYGIVFEKNGYIIKSGLNESEMDYSEPMSNRKYMSSYSKALKKFNLLAAELNRLHENKEGLNLFGEQDKKFVLKTPKPEVETPEVEPEMDLDLSDDSDMGGEDLDLDLDLETPEGEEDMDLDLDLDMGSETDDQDDEVSIKSIQKLTGKLGQKLRTIDSQEGLTSEDIKYVLNSIISAIDLGKLSEEDKEDILNNFEGDEIDYGVDDDADLDVDSGEELDLDMDFDLGDEESIDGEIGEHFFFDGESDDYSDAYEFLGQRRGDNEEWYTQNDNPYTGKFDFDYDEDEFDDYDAFTKRVPNQKWFQGSRGKDMFDAYREKHGPLKYRRRRDTGEIGEHFFYYDGDIDDIPNEDEFLGQRRGDNEEWYTQNDNPYTGKFDFDYDEDEFDDYDAFTKRVPNQKWFQGSRGKDMFDAYREKHGPLKYRRRRKTGWDTREKVIDEIFSESKIDKVLSKYFVVSDVEKVMTEQKNIKKFISEKVQKVNVRKEMKSMCETVEQEMTADFLLRENFNIKFLGKTNKGNLVFENKGQQIKVSQKGELL